MEALDWQDPELEKFVQFFVLIISFLAVFLDSKRLQDRSINGLVAVIPYILSIPYQFGLISDSILQFYVLVVLAARIYIFVNAGFLKGDDVISVEPLLFGQHEESMNNFLSFTCI